MQERVQRRNKEILAKEGVGNIERRMNDEWEGRDGWEEGDEGSRWNEDVYGSVKGE